MNANEEMCRCYGYTKGCECRECLSWERGYCDKTNKRKKCPPWGIACGKFRRNENVPVIA